MNLELYQNISDTKKIGKSLALIKTLNPILLKEGTDILHPVFTFHKFKDDETDEWIWKEFNYCKLKWAGFSQTPAIQLGNELSLKRCYFVDKFIMERGGIIEIHCTIDVRETWKDWILGGNYLVSRQEYIHNKCIPDERLAIPTNRSIKAKNIKSGGVDAVVGDGGDGTIVLTVTGGV